MDYIEGNLLDEKETVLIHGCNALGAFGSGFAGNLKKRHSEAADAYFAAHRANGLILGSVVWAQSRGIVIGNCITQPTYGRDGKRHISYDALRSCMRQVNEAAIYGIPGTPFEDGFSRVAMPLIGADLGGGDWSVISKIIEGELRDVRPVVYVLPGRRPSAAELSSLHS